MFSVVLDSDPQSILEQLKEDVVHVRGDTDTLYFVVLTVDGL